ncbi:ankyrin repeat-containing domain protein [Hypoxylon argillaceum]|nr:ankyrin repeat-containing domain protein [Hypoxylon argillaceum]
MPTGLDYIYFKNLELYTRLVGRSTQFQTAVTRSGAHHSAKEGLDSLRAYLLSRLSHTPAEQDEFMEILLIEEFLRSENDEDWVDFNALNTLFDYSLNLQRFRWKLSTSDMLHYIVKVAREQGMHPTVYHIVKTLIHKGAVIGAGAIYESVELQGSALLQLLLSYGADFKNQGAMAICEAMRLNNHEAVDRLLEGGANINATFKASGSEREDTILIYAHWPNWLILGTERNSHRRRKPWTITTIMKCEMLKHLISRNIALRRSPADSDPRHLLCSIITSGLNRGSFMDTFDKIRVILDAEPLELDQPRVAPCVLEACFPGAWSFDKSTLAQQLSLLHYLMGRGISAKHSGVLALLIRNRAPEDEIQRLLNSGVDINAYSGGRIQGTALQAAAYVGSLDWARVLVQRGADVNRPAKGSCGRTALQAACSFTLSQEGDSSKSHLIKFLIANGADVNAPPAAVMGVTAFQAAAWSGDFEHDLLLLDHGADINAPPSEECGCCALDGSVAGGQIDMVKFLLNLGAVSYDRRESGYRGAILHADQSKSAASQKIADMIRKHALENGKSGEELSPCQRQWDYDSSESSDDWDDTDEESGTWSENQTCWEDWLHF